MSSEDFLQRLQRIDGAKDIVGGGVETSQQVASSSVDTSKRNADYCSFGIIWGILLGFLSINSYENYEFLIQAISSTSGMVFFSFSAIVLITGVIGFPIILIRSVLLFRKATISKILLYSCVFGIVAGVVLYKYTGSVFSLSTVFLWILDHVTTLIGAAIGIFAFYYFGYGKKYEGKSFREFAIRSKDDEIKSRLEMANQTYTRFKVAGFIWGVVFMCTLIIQTKYFINTATADLSLIIGDTATSIIEVAVFPFFALTILSLTFGTVISLILPRKARKLQWLIVYGLLGFGLVMLVRKIGGIYLWG